MNIQNFFMARYEVLETRYFSRIWENLSYAQMRQQPQPQVNTVVWNLWHTARVEDVGVNRFVGNQPQALEAGSWNEKLGITVRHHGMGMTRDEMLGLSNQIDIDGLKSYRADVRQRTYDIVASLSPTMLDETLDDSYLRSVLTDEGAANSTVTQLLFEGYRNWTKGMSLMHFGLTHNYQHLGEVVTISSLIGVDVLGV